MVEDDNLECEPHPAIMLVSAAGLRLILEPMKFPAKPMKSQLLEFIKMIALKGLVFIDAINPKPFV